MRHIERNQPRDPRDDEAIHAAIALITDPEFSTNDVRARCTLQKVDHIHVRMSELVRSGQLVRVTRGRFKKAAAFNATGDPLPTKEREYREFMESLRAEEKSKFR